MALLLCFARKSLQNIRIQTLFSLRSFTVHNFQLSYNQNRMEGGPLIAGEIFPDVLTAPPLPETEAKHQTHGYNTLIQANFPLQNYTGDLLVPDDITAPMYLHTWERFVLLTFVQR